jgi:hypothetical protein
MIDAQASIRVTSRFANIALCCGLLAAAAMVYYHEGMFIPRALQSRASRNLSGGYSFGNDFYQIWFTARQCLPGGSNPYSEEITQKIQIGLYGRVLDPHNPVDPKDRRAFPYPAFVDLLFWPASQFPFPAARIVFFCLLLPLTAATVWLWMKALGCLPPWRWIVFTTALVLTSYPVLEGLYAVQVGLLVSFLIAAAMLALRRGNLLLSGILMGLTTIKPQMSALLIIFLIGWAIADLRTRRRFCTGLFASAGTLILAALIVWPRWLGSWMHILHAYRGYNPPPLLSQVLDGLFGPRLGGLFYLLCSVALIGGALWLGWRNRSVPSASNEFWFTLTLLLAVTVVVVLSGQAVYDHILLLPGILLLASHWRELSTNRVTKGLLTIGALVLFWPWIAACSLILLKPIFSDDRLFSKTIFFLPIYFAVALPFLVLAPLVLAIRDRRNAWQSVTVSS